MTDPKSILDAFQALTAAAGIAKGLLTADVSLAKAELKLKIADLAESLTAARLAVMEAQEEIHGLQRRIAQLEFAADVRPRLVRRNNVYFLKEGEEEVGPYCVRCFEADQRLMPLTKQPIGMRRLGPYQCPECKAVY